MTSLQLLLIAVVCSTAAPHAHGLPLSNFFSYGQTVGDSVLPRVNGATSPPVQLPEPFRLYGVNHTAAYVYANGVITFQNTSVTAQQNFPNEVASVAAFWTNVDLESTPSDGDVYYRVTSELQATLNFTDRVRESFRDSSLEFSGFTATQLLIVTWDRVKGVGTNQTNTFQCILATNDMHSYVFFLYADEMMNWAGSPYALVGFNAGDGMNHLTLPTSQSEAILDLTRTANSRVDHWIFRTDSSDIIQPGAVIGLDQASYTVNEGDSNVHVCVVLYDGVLARSVEVQVSSRLGGGSADATDFIAVTHTVTFSDSEVSGDASRQHCLDFDILDDDILEIDETFEIDLAMLQSVDVPVTILPHTTIVTILDDDDIVIEVRDTVQNVYEGEAGNMLCLSVIGQREVDFTYFYSLSPDTAQEGVDYVSGAGGEMTVGPTTRRACFPVSLVDDSVYRTGRRFFYNIGSHDSHVAVRNATGVAQISDNDEQSVVVGFDQSSYTVVEGDSVRVCVEMMAGAVGQPFTVNASTVLTSSINTLYAAEVGVDFDKEVHNITFYPEDRPGTEKCFTIDTHEDDVYEWREMYGVHLSFKNSFVAENSPALLVIEDNDVVEVSLSNSTYNATEGDYVVICAVIKGTVEGELPFNIEVEARTAEVSGQHSDINPQSIKQHAITFTSETMSHMECSSIFVVTDSTLEENPESFTVNLTAAARNPDPDHIHLVNASAEVFIRDIDVVRVQFLRKKRVVSESGRSVNPCVFIQGHSSVDIPVTLRYAEGNATDGVDYGLIGGEVSFSGQRSQSSDADCQGITVEIYDDPVVEKSEEVVIKLVSSEPERIKTSDTNKPNLTIIIEDDDVAYVSFVEQLLFVSEGEGGIDVCLKMRGFSTIELTASIATLQDTAIAGVDFEPQSVQLTFPPTNETVLDELYQLPVAERNSAPLHESSPVCSRVEILDDDVLEAVDTKLLRLDLTLSGPHVQFETPSTVYLTIMDDDVVTLEMEELEIEVNEGDGVARVCASMLGSADFPIRAVFTTSPDSAISPDDYNPEPVEIEFPANDNSPQCADIRIEDDRVLEYTETFYVSLGLSSPHHDRIELGNASVAVVTITDNDFVRVGFQQREYSTIESTAEVTVCADLEGALVRPVSISLSTSNETGTAEAGVDYTPVTNVTLFASLSAITQRTECVDISLIHDPILENTEVIEVVLSSSDDAVRFSRPTTSIYVLDDDGVRMGLMSRDYAGVEGEQIEICVELVGMISQDIGLNIRTEQISAQADSDYSSFSLPLVFHPLSVSNQKVCRNLSLLEDNIFEGQESLSVLMEVSHPRVSIHIGQATVVIQDNDEVTLSFLTRATSVSEDVGHVEACVELQGSTEETITYNVSTLAHSAQDSVDYRFTRSSPAFSFAPSTSPSQRQCHMIDIIDDDLLESTEQFSVHLSNNISRVNLINESMQVMIEDNDEVIVGLNKTEFLVLEEEVGGANITVCTVLRGRLQKNVTVLLTTEASSADTSDFTSLDETLTFVPSVSAEQTTCHKVEIHDDREVEGAEFFSIRLTSTEPMIVLQPASAVVTISEGDVVCNPQDLVSSRGYYQWPQTYPGEVAVLKCTVGGTATRFCTITGQWAKADVSSCLVSAAALFKYLKQHPFSEENFSELLYAVQLVKVEGGDAKLEYMEVVNSYFSQLKDKLESDRSFNFTAELFQMALDIADGVQEWPDSALQMYSSSFVSYTEHLIDSFIRMSNVTSMYHGMKHSSFFLEKGDLKDVFPTDKPKTIRFGRDVSDNFVLVADPSKAVTSSITLPPSLSQLFANSTGYVGAFFSMFDSGIMFPIAEGNGARRNETNVSSVISATVLDRAVHNLKDNITYTIQLNVDSHNVSGVICVSWDFDAVNGLGNWTDKGCTNLTDGSQGNVTCSCNHLTNFAVLVDVRPRPTEPGPITVMTPFSLSVISIIGVAVSVLGLILTIITLLAFKKLRTRDSTVLRIQFCVAVILMLLSFVAGIERVKLFEVCVTISTLIHYFTLVSLMWMAAEALLLFQKAIISTNVNYKFFVIVSLVCWLLPIPAAVVPVVLNRDYVTNEEFCFISHNIVFYAAFLGPIAAILVFNLLVFLVVVCVVIRHSARRYRESQKYSKRKGIMLTMLNIIAVSLLFGMTWVFGALTVQKQHELFEFLFVVSNSLQGFYVFIFFVVLAKETRELWLDTCGCRKKKEEPDAAAVPGTPTVTRVPSLRKPPAFNIDEYGNRLEELTVDTPDTRKRMNSWDIMYVMPQNQFHVLMFSDGQLQPQPELEQEEDIEKELDTPLSKKSDAGEGGLDIDNRSTADSGIMDDKAKSTPSPILGARSHQLEMAHPQPGGTPMHVHSVSGIGYVSDESAEDNEAHHTSITSKQAKSRDRSHDIELGGRMPVGSSGLTLETSKV